MEKSQVRGQVREIGAAGRHLRVVATQSPAVLSQRRKTSRGCDVWPGQLPKVRVRKRHPPGCYCLDLFSGVGGVARQCRALGYVCKEWDISWGKQFDLTDVAVRSRIKQDIAQGKVLAAMLAPPCSSFSRARDRTRVIRTARFPWGLPSRFLSDAESASITLGNKCFRAAIDLIQCLDKHRVPWILENPSTSKCWWLPPLKKRCLQPRILIFELLTSVSMVHRGENALACWQVTWTLMTRPVLLGCAEATAFAHVPISRMCS